jgi:hypothetical protein
MSGFNKFLQTPQDASGLTDGTTALNASTITAVNLNPSMALKTDVSSIVVSTNLDIADTNLLQATLDSKIGSPLTSNLDAGQFDIFNLQDIKIDTAGLGTDIATLVYNGTGNQTIDLNLLAGHVDSSSIPSVDNRITVFDGVSGELIRQSTTILESAGSLSGIVNLTNTGTINTNDNINLTSPTITNVLYGFDAGSALTAINRDTVAVGYQALTTATTSTRNTAVGFRSLEDTTSMHNTCVGYRSGNSLVGGNGSNCYIGHQAAAQSTSGEFNVSIGHDSMNLATLVGDENVAIGNGVAQFLTGNENVVIGGISGNSLNASNNNVFLGSRAGTSITTGDSNILIGHSAGSALTGADNTNVLIANSGVVGDMDQIRLGSSGTHTSCNIAGVYNVSPAGGSDEMVIQSSTGFLGTQTIPTNNPNEVTSAAVFANDNRLIRSNGSVRDVQTSGVTLLDTNILSGLAGITSSGSIDFDPCSSFSLDTSNNMVNAVTLEAAGGALVSMLLKNDSGTAANSILIDSTAGGVQIDTATGCNVASGGFNVAGNPGIACNTAPVVTNSIVKFSGTTGALASESGVIIDGSDNITNVLNLDVIGQITTGSNIVIDTSDSVRNTKYGFQSGDATSSGSDSVYIGDDAGLLYTTSSNLVIIGSGASALAAGNNNTIVGAFSANSLTGSGMTCVGALSMENCSSNINSTAIGNVCLRQSTGSNNTALGAASGNAVLSGTDNLLLGFESGINYTGTESNNICLMNDGVIATSAQILIGNATDHDFVQIPKELRIEEDSGSNFVGLKAPTLSANYDMTLPLANPPTDEYQGLVNRNGILEWVNSDTMPYPRGHIEDYRLAFTSVNLFAINAGDARDSTNVFNLNRSLRAMSMTVSGVGGIQASDFPQSASTWYNVFIIGDTSGSNVTEAIMLEAASGNPVVTGYDVFRRVGAVRNNSSSDLYEWGDPDAISHDRLILWQEPETVLELLTDGAATTWTNLDISDLVPPSSRVGYINTNHSAGTTEDFASFRTAGLGGGTSPVTNPKAHRCFGGSSTGGANSSTCFFINTDNTQNIEYGNSSAGEDTDVWVLGYIDNLD